MPGVKKSNAVITPQFSRIGERIVTQKKKN